MTRRALHAIALLLTLSLAVALAGATAVAAQPKKPKPTIKPEPAPVLPARVADKDGKTVVVRNVSRIVPLNGDIAETVFTLGLKQNVVGVDTSATYPPKAVDALPKIGYQRTLSAEGILSLRPTVVIGSPAAGPPPVIEQLRTAGVTVVIVPEYKGITAGAKKLRVVGRALGVPKRGERLARKVESQVKIAKREVDSTLSRPRVAFLYLRGSQVQMIGGKTSGADAMIAAAGGRDVGVEAGIDGFKPYSAEALVAARPDVLLLLTAGLQSVGGEAGLLRIPGVAQTPAGQNRRFVHYDDLLLLGLGPRTGKALRLLIRGLHPELR
jgi:iron complex transport system substrate-binding protein